MVNKTLKHETFGVLAELRDKDRLRTRPLSMFGLTYDRLVEDIILPYQQGKLLVIDGHAVSNKSVARIKIVRIPTDLDEQFRSIVISASGTSQSGAIARAVSL